MQKKYIIGLIFILLLIGLFSHLDKIGLRGEEPRRAIVGVETYVHNNYIVPQIVGETYYNKPPLNNWVLALFFFIFQSFSEWVVRLPGILTFLGTGAIVYFFTRKHINKTTGLLAAGIYLTTLELLFYGTINAGEIDLLYTFIVTLQAFVIFHFTMQKRYFLMFLLSYGLTLAGLMTKGLPSLVFQAFTILAMLIYIKKWKLLFSWQHIVSILLFISLLGGYFYMFEQRDDLQAFIVNQVYQSSDKSFNNSNLNSVAQFLFVFPLLFLKTILPWSPLLLLLFVKNIRKTILKNKLIQFAILFILVNIPIYWLSPAIRSRYLYMFFPFTAIVMATILIEIKQHKKINQVITKLGGALLILATCALYVFPFVEKVSKYADHLAFITILFTIFFAALFIVYLKIKDLRIYTIILLLLLGRIWMNFTVFPYFHQSSKVREYYIHVEKMAELINNEPILWTGATSTLRPSINIFGQEIINTAYTIPPELPYSIPYHYFKQTGHIFKHTEKPEAGKYYLAGDKLIDQTLSIDTIYQFKEYWYNRNLILFKLKE